MKNCTKHLILICGLLLAWSPIQLNAQCATGETFYTYCYGSLESDAVAFEVCPTAGLVAEAEIIMGTLDPFGAPNDNLTVYQGASGSGATGTILFGPSAGDLMGTVITGTLVDQCLIFVFNSDFFGDCSDNNEKPLQVCGRSVAGSVSFTAPADLCITDGVQNNLSGGAPTGGVYSGPGVTDDGNGMTYDFDPAAAGVGVHTITYTNGGAASDDVEVFAANSVTFTAPNDLCIDAGIQSNLSGGMPTGGVYSGSGVTDNGDGTYDFNPALAGLGLITISYTTSTGCAETVTDNVEVLAACGCPAGQTNFFYCYGNLESNNVAFEVCPTAGLAAQADIIGGTFDSFDDNLTVYQGPTGSGTSGAILFGPSGGNLNGTTIMGNIADNCLIFVINSGAIGSCQDGFELPLQVCGSSIAPSVTFTAPADLCINAGLQSGLSGGLPTGGVYSGPGVTDAGDGMTYSFNPTTAGVGVHTLTYTFSGASASDDIEVFDRNLTTFTALADLCIDAGIQTGQGGGMPTGGMYSGPGVTDDGNGMTYTFNPGIAGLGTHTISYMTFDGCMEVVTDDVEVLAACGCPSGQTSFFHCYDNNETDLVIFEMCPSAGLVAKVTINQGTYDPFGAPNDNLTVYQGASGSGTSGTLIFGPMAGNLAGTEIIGTELNQCLIFVSNSDAFFSCQEGLELPLLACGESVPPPTMFTAPADLCINDGVQSDLSGGTPTGGVYSGPGVIDDNNGMTYDFDPAIAGVGIHTITYTANGEAASDDIEVFAVPNVNLSTVAAYCLDAPIQNAPITGGSPTGGVYSGPGVTDNGLGTGYSLDPTVGGPGTITITYTYTDANGCSGVATSDIEIIDCDYEISEACGCLDNATILDLDNQTGGDDGQFSETIRMVGTNGNFLPVGQTWTITAATGAFDAYNIPTVGTQSAGVPVSTGEDGVLNFDEMNSYFLTFVHIDQQPYSITIEGPFPAGSAANQSFTISNQCQYPNPIFDPALLGSYCAADPAVTLGGIDQNGEGADNISFTIDGNPATSLDPSALSPGTHTVVMSFDGAADNNNGISPDGGTTPASPGCTQDVQTVVEIIAGAPPEITCPDDNFGLAPGCNPSLPPGTTQFNTLESTGPNPAWPTVSEGCGMVTVTFSDMTEEVNCVQTVSRTYTATDALGNTDQCTQTFTFTVDTDPPMFTSSPMDVTVECDMIPDAPDVMATDNCPSGVLEEIFINEFHYDNSSTDVGEFVEVAGTAGFDLSNCQIILYNGNGGASYNTVNLSGMIDDESNGYGAVSFSIAGIQNGSPDGIALVCNDELIEFISYEGSFMATDGAASGVMSTDVGVSEPSSSAVGNSLQKTGMGCLSGDFNWVGPIGESPGSLNTNQMIDPSCSQDGPLVELDENIIPGTCPNDYIIMRTWTATDACGNTATTMQSVKVEDNTPPTFTSDLPMNMSIECDELQDPPVLEAMDNCTEGTITAMFNENFVEGDCPQAGVLTRTWMATDACGNTATHVQMITIDDTTPPTFMVPGPVTLSCDDDPEDLELTGEPTMIMDNCDPGGGATPSSIWINEIHYDNVSTDVGEFVEVAGTAGIDLSDFEIVLYNGNGGATYNTVALSGTIDDEGSGFGAISFAISGIQNGAPDGLALVQGGTNVIEFLSYEGSFTATNGPANGATSTDIGVEETGSTVAGQSVQRTGMGTVGSDFSWVGPIGESPGSLNADQMPMAPPPTEGLLTQFFDSFEPTCGGLLDIITRTWTVTDACGNVATQTQTISIIDDTPPSFTIPADITIECSDDITDLTVTGDVSNVMDNCDPNPMVMYNDVENLNGCGGYTGTVDRIWMATDACGNNSTPQTQTITIVDTTDPTFTVPADVTIECDDDPTDLSLTGDVTDAMDNCTGVSAMDIWINEFHYDNASSDVGEFIEVAGTEGLDLSIYSFVLYNGANGLTYNTVNLSGMVDAESNGFGAVSFAVAGIQNGSPDGIALVRNGTNVLEFLSYEGSFMAMNGPANGMMSTDIGISEGGATAIGQSLQLIGTGSTGADFTWSGPTDESPGMLNAGQTLNAVPGPSSMLMISSNDESILTTCDGGTISRTWTVTDACGNNNVQVQTITVNPPPAPIIECIPNATVECEEDIMVSEEDVTVISSCVDFEIIIRGPAIYGNPGCNTAIYEYSYTVVDECGNSDQCTRFITIENDGPTITCPPGGVVECRDDIVVSPNNASFTTSCDYDATVAISGPVVDGPDGCPGTTYTYTYKVTDECGRMASCEQVFTIGDNDGPTIQAPADQPIECAYQINVNPNFATVTTSCDADFEVTVSEPVINGQPDCPGTTYTFTYTVTDACGRTASDIRIFTIDNEGPIVECPNNLFLNCEDFAGDALEAKIQAWLSSASAESSCGIPATVTNNYNPNTLGLCISDPFTDVTFFATDACGRTSSCMATIIIADTEAPSIKQEASDASASCYDNFQLEFQQWLAIQGGAVAIDACWENVSWSTIPAFPTINCNGGFGSTTVTFVATDGCGNSATTTATFTVIAGTLSPGSDPETVVITEDAPKMLRLLQNRPNPFKYETTIGFYLPEAGEANLSIFDVSGRLIHQFKDTYTSGYNEVVINRADLPTSGVLYYRLDCESGSASKKMILLD